MKKYINKFKNNLRLLVDMRKQKRVEERRRELVKDLLEVSMNKGKY